MSIAKVLVVILLSYFGFNKSIQAQHVAIKTNVLYGGIAQAPNLGFEFAISNRMTVGINGSYNGWHLNDVNTPKHKVHWLASVEWRYWLDRKMVGHFFGLQVLGSKYNISHMNLPLIFGKDSKEFRFMGDMIGFGFNYGYQLVLSRRWSLEGVIGLGYGRLHYDRYNCHNCGDKLGSEERSYFGPTNAAISVIYIIN